MYDRLIKLFILAALIIANPTYASNQFPDWFTPFPLASLENQSASVTQDYQLPLSQITRIQGLLRTQNELRLKGDLIRRTWQLSPGNTPEQGFDHVRDQLLRQQANILFECSSRQCGASNLWANQVFGYANLLGVDSTQFYLAAEIETGHMAVYAVRRGNGRSYLHIDYIHVAPAVVEQVAEPQMEDVADLTWQQQLGEVGYVDLHGWSAAEPETLQRLLALLDDDLELKLRIVVHQKVNTGDTGLTESNAQAQRLESELLESGVMPERVSVFGIGSLAPSILGSDDHAITLIRLEE
ncbi:MAG: DUF4892 domain-containing protein [Oceanospirillales bacterium]|nr:MAG: DUF4892 domain-containing protein [Oceanospirillales bacterium]